MGTKVVERMADSLFANVDFRCTLCGAPHGTCTCWTRCDCGWSYETEGGKCRNPVHLPVRSRARLLSLDKPGWSLRKPVDLTIEDYDGEVIAIWDDADVWGAGATAAGAIADLRSNITGTYTELCGFEPSEMGVIPKRMLATMRAVIVRTEA